MNYTLKTAPLIFTNNSDELLLLHDEVELPRIALQAHVRSGDYLATLATQLDELSQAIKLTHESESTIMQGIVDDLLYLQTTHDILKK